MPDDVEATSALEVSKHAAMTILCGTSMLREITREITGDSQPLRQQAIEASIRRIRHEVELIGKHIAEITSDV